MSTRLQRDGCNGNRIFSIAKSRSFARAYCFAASTARAKPFVDAFIARAREYRFAGLRSTGKYRTETRNAPYDAIFKHAEFRGTMNRCALIARWSRYPRIHIYPINAKCFARSLASIPFFFFYSLSIEIVSLSSVVIFK